MCVDVSEAVSATRTADVLRKQRKRVSMLA
jgi:hypothetical protein